jgi:chromosome segregation ATPase
MQNKLKAIFGSHHGLDEKSIEYLTKALEKKNLPGLDYLEFKQSLGAMLDLDMEETMAFKSAFAASATMGLTKEKLKKTAEHYKNVLTEEKEQFDAALEKQVKIKIESKKEEVAKLRKQVQDWQSKIKQLEEKIAKAEGTIASADSHIKAHKEKIDATRESFEFTWQSILNQINIDIENIDKYLS